MTNLIKKPEDGIYQVDIDKILEPGYYSGNLPHINTPTSMPHCKPSRDEKDPNGLKSSDPGAKLDAGKTLGGLIFDFGLALCSIQDINLEEYELYKSNSGEIVSYNDYKYCTNEMFKSLCLEHVSKYTDDNIFRAVHTARWALIRLEVLCRERQNITERVGCDSMLEYGLSLDAVAQIGTYGAQKYSRGGWQHVENGIIRYTDALGRHFMKERFEFCDKDTDMFHASHLCWNALARLELMLRENYKDMENS